MKYRGTEKLPSLMVCFFICPWLFSPWLFLLGVCDINKLLPFSASSPRPSPFTIIAFNDSWCLCCYLYAQPLLVWCSRSWIPTFKQEGLDGSLQFPLSSDLSFYLSGWHCCGLAWSLGPLVSSCEGLLSLSTCELLWLWQMASSI